MFERFVGDARQVALEAISVAAGLGSPSVEAEHLLVSLAGSQHRAGDALRDVGLDSGSSATRSSATSSGSSAGRDRRERGGLSANCRRTKPRWGASAKRGLERALEEAKRRGDRRIGCEHILLGLLRAEHGTVPRLLAAEGIDRTS